MTDLSIERTALQLDAPAPRPRGGRVLIAAVATLMSGRPLGRASQPPRSRGSPPRHLRADLGLAPSEDQWWRALDRW